MRSIRSRAAALVLAVLLLLPPDAAVSDACFRGTGAEEAAEILYGMGVLRGCGTLPDGSPDFQLGRPLARGEAVALLARLAGAEEEALSGAWEHPFSDAGWADGYVGWAYANGVAYGIGDGLFGTSMEIPRNQFVTLVLRVLGHGVADWRDPYPEAEACGIYCGDISSAFVRGDAALAMLSALASADADIPEGGVPSGALPSAPAEGAIPVASPEEFVDAVGGAALSLADGASFSVPPGMGRAYVEALQAAVKDSDSAPAPSFGFFAALADAAGDTIRIAFGYCDDARIMRWLERRTEELSDRDRETYEAAYAVWSSLAGPRMGEYDLARAFHDWIVDNCEYDLAQGPDCHDAYGVFVGGRAVCDGYAKAMNLLCYLGGLESVRVLGVAADGRGNTGRHAWNKVRVDGAWYDVDATWDDPSGPWPALRHDYFLVGDADLAGTHSWNASYSSSPRSSNSPSLTPFVNVVAGVSTKLPASSAQEGMDAIASLRRRRRASVQACVPPEISRKIPSRAPSDSSAAGAAAGSFAIRCFRMASFQASAGA